jgi:ADP-ribose pyrophosphatase YjhB (NUDIX family)
VSAKRFCSQCAGPLTVRKIGGRQRSCCERCNTVFYENPLPVVSAIVVNSKRELLLVKRGSDPYRGMWCLPMGFAETGEAMEDAALRELSEETGLEGVVVSLVAIDTVNDAYYGSIAIIAYEVRRTGGTLAPGDDADETRLFPLNDLPELAWDSNRKAVQAFVKGHQDTWDMVDSCRNLFAEAGDVDIVERAHKEGAAFLSDVLVRVIERHVPDIAACWQEDMKMKTAVKSRALKLLLSIHGRAVVEAVTMLKGGSAAFGGDFFFDAGHELKNRGVAVADMLNAMALSRKAIWSQVAGRRVFKSPRTLYATLELSSRIVFLYDRINHYLARGYASSPLPQ